MRVNVVGAGARGRQLLGHLLELGGVEVGFIADPSVEGRGRVSHEFPHVTTTAEIRGTLRDPRVDAIVLATPPENHVDFARMALEAGKHLLVASPLALDTDASQELTRLASDRGAILALGYARMFDAGVHGLRELIASGELGHIRHVHVVNTRLGPHRGDISALWTLGADDLSILQHWLELTPVHVSATAGCFVAPGVADVVDATLMYAGGLRTSLHVSWLSPTPDHKLTIVGERAMATLDLEDRREPLLVYDRAMSVDSHPIRCRIRDNGVTVVPIEIGDCVRDQVQHFVECIREGRAPRNNGEWATRIARQLVSLEHSIKESGNRITVGLRRHSPAKGPLRRTFAERAQERDVMERAEQRVPIVRPRAVRPKTPR